MPQVSQFSELSFLALVALMAVVFIIALWRAGERFESRQTSLRWAALAIALIVVWMSATALIARTGILREFDRRPPPFIVFVSILTLATTVIAFSRIGTRLIEGIDIRWLAGFQVFRIPVELWLHRLYQEGVVPVQMTYAGLNYDIISGILGAIIFVWASARRPPRWAIRLFNLIGMALLINIVTIAILSAPTPMRRFFNEPANTFVTYFPFVWLPAVLVQAAWFGHLLVFRWLRKPRSRFL
jgi:hypothetical protein